MRYSIKPLSCDPKDYGAASAKYVDAFMENIRWDNVSRLHQGHAR